MDRHSAHSLCKKELEKANLKDWGVRLSTSDRDRSYLGLCSYKDKVIILNAFHVDIHPDLEIIDTIKHEVAHAIVGAGHGHNDVWAAKAKELGCTNTLPCSHLDLPEKVIDAIRSGQMVEMTVEEETHIIRKPKYTVTRLQDKCPECGKVAKEKFSIETIDREGNTVKLITLDCFHIIKKIIPRGTPFDKMMSNDWDERVKNCKHKFLTREESKGRADKWPTNRCLNCNEFLLFKFQVMGAQLAESGLSMQKGFGVFDDMGLGKTVQALAVVKFHAEYTPTLYVTKSAIMFQWFKQIHRWLGPDYMGQVIATGKDYLFPGLKSYIISYDMLRRFPKEKLQALNIKLVVLDECQQIKNADSGRTQEVRKLVGMPNVKVLPLSGTPWKNRGNEFFPVLNMMDPIKFYSNQDFLDTWVDYYYEGPKRKMGGIRNIPKFKLYTESLIVRREYNEVMDEFPEINRMKLNVQLDELTQSTYDDSVSEFVAWYNEAVIGGEEDNLNGMEILAKMSRMRHITGLAKIPATLGFIEEFIEDTDKKLVIFVHHKDVGELMVSALKNPAKESNPDWYHLAAEIRKQNIPVYKYTSELSDGERFDMQEAFNKSKRAIMVASTLACGEGVDLQTCADSILHERQWNPQNEDQATPGRFRRIGQMSGVINITVPESEGTIDELLDGIVESKRKQFHSVMNKGEMPTWSDSAFAKELAQIIVAKHREKNKGKEKTNITNKAQMKPRYPVMIGEM